MENKTGNIITHFGRTRASKSNKKQAIPAHPTSAAKQKNKTESAPSQSPALEQDTEEQTNEQTTAMKHVGIQEQKIKKMLEEDTEDEETSLYKEILLEIPKWITYGQPVRCSTRGCAEEGN